MKIDGIGNLCLWCMEELADSLTCPYCGHDEREPMHAEQAIAAGQIIGRHYLVGRCLGQGGFGITYLAYDLDLHVKRAIKEYFPQGMVRRDGNTVQVTRRSMADAYQKGVESFYREAQSIARFGGHPNVVQVHTFFRENNTAYFVMDYVDGRSFQQYLEDRGGRISWEETLHILKPIGEALTALHASHLLHRDVKPANIFITRDGTPKLLDFGAARYEASEINSSSASVLTPGYAPVEQYGSISMQGPFTDVYAFCATFYRAVSGVVPIPAPDRTVKDSLLPLDKADKRVPAQISAALKHGMEARRENRTQSVAQVLKEMESASSSRRWVFLCVAAGVIIAAILWLFTSYPQKDKAEILQTPTAEQMTETAPAAVLEMKTPTVPFDAEDFIETAWMETEQIKQTVSAGIALTQAAMPTETPIPLEMKTPTAPFDAEDYIETAWMETEQIKQTIAAGIAQTQTAMPTKTPTPTETKVPTPTEDRKATAAAKKQQLAQIVSMRMEQTQTAQAALPTQTPTKIPTPTLTPTPKPHLDADKVFARENIVSFGSYPQSYSAPEAIAWRVLDRGNGMVLLLSKYALDAHRFSEGPNTWYDATNAAHRSEIRDWLNNTFYNKAFTGEEKNIILEVSNTDMDLDPSPDRVFLLSLDEVHQYLPYEKDRQVDITEYARKQKIYVNSENGRTTWWTRTYMGITPEYSTVYCIQSTGVIPVGGCKTTDKDNGVVPAIWVNEAAFLEYLENQ